MQARHSTRARRATLYTTTFGTCGVLMLMLMLATHAHAQAVRKCEVDGRTVFQAAPCAIEARANIAAAVAPAAPASGARKRTLADVLRERDGADPARAVSQPLQTDGATVLRARMGAV
jgi:hypothetical protein